MRRHCGHLTREGVERHVERMNKFKRLLPKYADMRIQGAVAGMVVDEDAIEAAQAAGLWYWGVTRHAWPRCASAYRAIHERVLAGLPPALLEVGLDGRVTAVE